LRCQQEPRFQRFCFVTLWVEFFDILGSVPYAKLLLRVLPGTQVWTYKLISGHVS
jgi:hypothetical protein